MALELFPENSCMSPRISFSHDLCHFDVVPVEQRPHRSKSSSLNSSIDFDFCIHEQESSASADELFSDGKILPTVINKNNIPSNQTIPCEPPPALLKPSSVSKKEIFSQNRMITRDETGEDETEEKQSSKSFWGFKRSRSFNCGSGYGRSLCPFPLLSRSNSTGSHKHNSLKHHAVTSTAYKSSTSYNQKPPLRKSYKCNGNGGQVNHVVLNVPSANLLGFCSIFFNAKDKNHKKK